MQRANNTRSSLTTRLLFTVIPSELYWNDLTLDALLSALADDLHRLYENGVSVTLQSIAELITSC